MKMNISEGCEIVKNGIGFLFVGTKEGGDRSSTVVKVLYYKSEGHWFDRNWYQWIFH